MEKFQALLYIVLTTISNKHTDTHRPPELQHRQMRHDVCKPLSNTDNRAAINTDNWFQQPSYSLTRHFVSSPFTRLTEIKQTNHASMQIHTHCKSKEDLLHGDTYAWSCTCFWQDNNQNLMKGKNYFKNWFSCLGIWKLEKINWQARYFKVTFQLWEGFQACTLPNFCMTSSSVIFGGSVLASLLQYCLVSFKLGLSI